MPDAITFAPPSIISENEIKEILDAFGRALQDIQKWGDAGVTVVGVPE